MASFGYTGGMGSGDQTFLGPLSASYYVNTTGSTVYVDTVTVLNVKTAAVTGLKGAIYSDTSGAGAYPHALLATTTALTSVTVGSNALSVVGDPVAVGPGEGVWAALEADTNHIVFTGSGLTGGAATYSGVSFGGAVPTQFSGDPAKLNLILPATLSGSTSGPGHTTNERAPLVVSEPLIEGFPAAIVPLVLSEPLTEGFPDARVALVLSEPLTEGDDHLRASLILTEALHPLPPELPVATAVFPALRGLTWDTKKSPKFNTAIRGATSGRETRTAFMQYPIWNFEQTYEYLPDNNVGTSGYSDLRTLEGFYMQMRGSFEAFLYHDKDDYQATSVQIATGDGVTLQWPFARSFGGFLEPVGQVDVGHTLNVYVDGALQTLGTDYTITMPNQLVFPTAPAAGQVITWTGQYFFVCRFVDDPEFSQFASKLWELNKLTFQSVIQ